MNTLSRTLCPLLIMIALMVSTLSAQFSFTSPISITGGDSSFGHRSPKLAVNGQGELLVFWMRTGSNEGFFFSKLTDTGFSAAQQIPFGSLNPNLWSGSLGPGMAASGDHIYVTFEVYGDAIYVIHSGDGGLSWSPPVAAFIPPQGRRATIPVIACDADAQPLIAYVNTNAAEGDAHYGLVRSTDHGATFLPEVTVNEAAAGVEVCECCNGHISADGNGGVYVAFRNNNANLRDIWIAHSEDNGDSFSMAYDMDETDWVSGVCPSNGPHFIVDEDAVTSVFFSAASTWGAGSYISSLDLNQGTVSPTLGLPLADESSTSQNFPRIAGSGDTLMVVWQENHNGSQDIAIATSITGTAGLQNAAIFINENTGSQSYPQILFHEGLFHIVYEDAGQETVMYQGLTPGTVGLTEITSQAMIVYPNPSQGKLYFSEAMSQETLIQIFNLKGQLVQEIVLEAGEASADLSSLRPGYYFVQWQEKEKEIRWKVLLE